MINYNQLRVFYHVAKNLNLSQAAKELFITQPAVTHSMKTFEEICNLKLIKKSSNKIQLTEEGKKLYEYAQKVFEFEREIETAIDDMSKMGTGILKLGFPKTFVQSFASYITDIFKKRQPNIILQVKEGSSLSIIHSIVNFEIELGICSKVEDHPEVEFDHMLREELVCIGSPNHRFSKKGPIAFMELAREPIILKEEGAGTRKLLLEIYKENNVTPNTLLEASNSDWIKNLVHQGKGISFLVGEAVAPEIEEGRLIKIPIKEYDLYLDIYLVYLKEHHFSFPAKAFLKMFVQTLPGKKILPTLVPSWPEGCDFIHALK